jgi:hypothetical protein
LIAVVSAGLLFVGCDNGTTTESGPAGTTPDGVVIDKTVDNPGDLVKALAEVTTIAYVLDGGNGSLNAVTIPERETVYLLNYSKTPAEVTTNADGLHILGTLIVSESVKLKAADGAKVVLLNTGTLKIQDGGELETQYLTSVNNLDNAGVGVGSVLGQVRYEGGSTLTIGDEGDLTKAEIEKLLGYITPLPIAAKSVAGQTGNPSSLALVAELKNFQPSDINDIIGIQALRTLAVKPGKAESTDEITIPVGAVVTVPTDKLGSVTKLIVNGTLTAPQATGNVTDGVKITVGPGAELAVASVKVATESTVGVAGKITGELNGPITPAPGAIINGFVSTGTTPVTFINDTTLTTTIDVKADETVQLGKGTFAAITSVKVAAGGVLSIPVSAVVKPTALATFDIAGTVKVGGAFNFITTTPAAGLTGTIEVLAGGSTSDVNGSGSLWGSTGSDTNITYSTGKYVYYTGSKASLGAGEGTIKLVDDKNNTDAILVLTAGNLTLTRTRYELNGAAILKQTFGITAGMTLDIPANSVLTIPSGQELHLYGNAVIAGTVTGSATATASKITTTAASVTTITGKSNFYRVNEDDPPVVTTLSSLPAGKTYTWTAADDGKSAGWVESDE